MPRSHNYIRKKEVDTMVKLYSKASKGQSSSMFKKVNAGQAKAIATNSAKKVLSKNSQLKYIDYYLSSQSIDNTGYIQELSAVPTSTAYAQGDNSRIGDQIMPKRLQIRFVITDADAYNVSRVVIFRWKMNDTSDAPNVADIMDDAGTVQFPYATFPDNTRKQFEVLYDHSFLTVAGSSYGVTQPQCINLKLAEKAIEYKTSAVTTGTNKIFMGLFGDSATGAHPRFLGKARFWFTDI